MSSARKMLTIQETRQSHLPGRNERDNEFSSRSRSPPKHPRRSTRRGGFSDVEVWGRARLPNEKRSNDFFALPRRRRTQYGVRLSLLCGFRARRRADLARGRQFDGAGDLVQLFQLRGPGVRRHIPSAAAPFPRFLRLPWRSEFSLAARPDMGEAWGRYGRRRSSCPCSPASALSGCAVSSLIEGRAPHFDI